MLSPSSVFGWKNVLNNYGWKGFLVDSILPILVSSILCIIIYANGVDVFIQLKHIVGIGISIVPSMVALILTANTIMLAFIFGDAFTSTKQTENGKKLIRDLNSSFAACLLVSIISVIVMIIVSSIASMNIEINKPDLINYSVLFLVCYLLVFSVSILLGIVIDIFNSGQTTLLND